MYRQNIIWTISMVDFLIDHHKEMNNTALAGHLGISLSCLRRKLHELGLRKRPVTKVAQQEEHHQTGEGPRVVRTTTKNKHQGGGQQETCSFEEHPEIVWLSDHSWP